MMESAEMYLKKKENVSFPRLTEGKFEVAARVVYGESTNTLYSRIHGDLWSANTNRGCAANQVQLRELLPKGERKVRRKLPGVEYAK